MKFSSILSAFTLVSAAPVAEPFFWSWGPKPVPRNATECASYIESQAAKIVDAVKSFNEVAANSRKNDILGLLKVQSTADSLIKLVDSTGEEISSTCPNQKSITIMQALPMTKALLAIPAPVNKTMDTVIAKKPVYDHAILYIGNLSWLVKIDLNKVRDGIENLVGAISANVESNAASVVTKVRSDILTPVDKARAVYNNWANLPFV